MQQALTKWWPQVRGATSAKTATLSLAGLTLLLIVCGIFALGLGAVHLTPAQTVAILLRRAGVVLAVDYGPTQELVLWTLRLPRVVLGVLVGAGLSVAGATMQGLFRNPLADPGLVGMSSGGALSAALVMALGPAHLDTLPGMVAVTTAAIAGSGLSLFAVYRVSHLRGRTLVTTMVLTGIAVNAMAGAITGFVTYVANVEQLRNLTFWSLGSLGQASWAQVAAVAPFVGAACLLLPRLARALNAALLGDVEAAHLGFDVRRTRLIAMVLMALAVGASVAVAGVIGFLGLLAPHLARLLVGADHRALLPGSALLGGALVLLADVLARTLAAPAEVPVGIMTALLGAPFFLWLLVHERTRAGM